MNFFFIPVFPADKQINQPHRLFGALHRDHDEIVKHLFKHKQTDIRPLAAAASLIKIQAVRTKQLVRSDRHEDSAETDKAAEQRRNQRIALIQFPAIALPRIPQPATESVGSFCSYSGASG